MQSSSDIFGNFEIQDSGERGGEYSILILSIESWLSPWSGPRRGRGGAEGGYLAYDYISYRYSR